MTTTTYATRTAWEDMSTPAEFTADCRAAEARLAAPSPRTPLSPTTPEHRFEDLSSLAADVAYELD
ncbi:hypothetical protein [Nocardioides sp.]|uniref:hypothetical protein n=1 Tax=Nocardioides sp. TaxID=35761 RepID=UPI002615A8CB|nr:hypothetical protein [Nocardioides sp.]